MNNGSWTYENNPFLNATDNSFRAAKKIGDFTDLGLYAHPGDAFLAGLYAALHPSVANYNARYALWLGQQSGHKAQTAGLNALFKELSGAKIRSGNRE